MDQIADRNAGFSVLDGVALVVASAVASVHIRGLVNEASGAGWALVWLALAGVSLTSAGPFLYLVRKTLRRLDDYPRRGDMLWAMLGAPWILSAPFRTPRTGTKSNGLDLYGMTLTATLGLVCVAVMAILWKMWIVTPPEARPIKASPARWTERFGMALAVVWPLQCGFLLVVLDNDTLPPFR